MTPDAAERRARALLDGHSLARDAAPDLARDVLALADALATAEASIARLRADLERADGERQRVESERDAMEEQRDTARSALDGLTAAVRAEREATDALRFDAHHRSGFSRFDDGEEATEARATELRSATALDDARRATDALLAAAPPRTTVEARAVREYLAAVEAFDGGALGAPCRASIRVDDTRAALVAALERCP